MSGRFETYIVTLTKLMLLPTIAVLDCAELLFAYHGWDVPEIGEILGAVDAL